MKKSTILLGFATCIAKIVCCKYIFRRGKRIDQFGFAGIVDVTEHDIPACLQCPDPPACIGFAGGEVDGLLQVLLDDVSGKLIRAEERGIHRLNVLCCGLWLFVRFSGCRLVVIVIVCRIIECAAVIDGCVVLDVLIILLVFHCFELFLQLLFFVDQLSRLLSEVGDFRHYVGHEVLFGEEFFTGVDEPFVQVHSLVEILATVFEQDAPAVPCPHAIRAVEHGGKGDEGDGHQLAVSAHAVIHHYIVLYPVAAALCTEHIRCQIMGGVHHVQYGDLDVLPDAEQMALHAIKPLDEELVSRKIAAQIGNAAAVLVIWQMTQSHSVIWDCKGIKKF